MAINEKKYLRMIWWSCKNSKGRPFVIAVENTKFIKETYKFNEKCFFFEGVRNGTNPQNSRFTRSYVKILKR